MYSKHDQYSFNHLENSNLSKSKVGSELQKKGVNSLSGLGRGANQNTPSTQASRVSSLFIPSFLGLKSQRLKGRETISLQESRGLIACRGAGIIGVSLLVLSGCALSTESLPSGTAAGTPSPAKLNPQPAAGEAVPPALSAQLSYGDDHEDSIDFAMDERRPVFRNLKPITIPSNMPDSMKISLPTADWKNLTAGAFALFGQEVRELKATGSAQSKDLDLNINSNEVSISGLKEAFPQGPGLEGEISLTITSTVGTQANTREVHIHFRTPPKAPQFEESPLINLSQLMPISPNYSVMPLRFYKLSNTTQQDWTLEMPYQPSGQIVHQIRRTTFNQGNCSVSQGSGMERAEFTHQFILVPEGTGQSQMVKILSEQGEKVSAQKVPSKGSVGYVLYAVTSTSSPDPRMIGRNWTGPAKALSPSCGPSACSKRYGKLRRIHWPNMNCLTQSPWNEIDEGRYCSTAYVADCDRQGNCDRKGKNEPWEVEFGACQSYFIDPVAPVSYNDYTEILGNALVSADLTSQGRLYFDGIKPAHADQASPLEKVQSEVSLWGNFNFSK